MKTVDEPRPARTAAQHFWNRWNTTFREGRSYAQRTLDTESMRRARMVLEWLGSLPLPPGAHILEVGCGTGWLAEELARHGTVTAVDLADDVIARARERHPDITYIAGDVMTVNLRAGAYDLVVTLETLSCFSDQPAFVARLRWLLKPGGHLLLTTQNRIVYERRGDVQPVAPGQIRRWVSRRELRALLEPRFRVLRMATVFPGGDRGVLRVVNSYKLNAALRLVVGAARLERWKERAGLGRSIVALARGHIAA
jgi:2-polyprenyl-3-methyl-5-hydroxy-6-metoxy-1,4-benzoquinol methylase